jgi:sec-independent protein translocase protein TatA
MTLAMFIGLGINELLVILLIVLVLFGASRVPQLMRGLGQGIREFKGALNDDDKSETAKPADEDGEKQPPLPAAHSIPLHVASPCT